MLLCGDVLPALASPVSKRWCLVPACKRSFALGRAAERNSYWEPAIMSTSEANQSLYCCHPHLANCPCPRCFCTSKGADVSARLSTRLFLWGNRLCFVLAQLVKRPAHFPAPVL